VRYYISIISSFTEDQPDPDSDSDSDSDYRPLRPMAHAPLRPTDQVDHATAVRRPTEEAEAAAATAGRADVWAGPFTTATTITTQPTPSPTPSPTPAASGAAAATAVPTTATTITTPPTPSPTPSPTVQVTPVQVTPEVTPEQEMPPVPVTPPQYPYQAAQYGSGMTPTTSSMTPMIPHSKSAPGFGKAVRLFKLYFTVIFYLQKHNIIDSV
jgi:hypothetical protein